MGNELNFWVVGGDLRQAKLAELLAADGHTVRTWALERMGALPGVRAAETLAEAERADCVVLPLPAAGEGGGLNAPLSEGEHPMAEVLDALRPGQVLCAGRVDPATAALAAARGLTLHDYFAREELAVANAVPTALAKGHRGFPASNRPESPVTTPEQSSAAPNIEAVLTDGMSVWPGLQLGMVSQVPAAADIGSGSMCAGT